jgi:hypothetical protein
MSEPSKDPGEDAAKSGEEPAKTATEAITSESAKEDKPAAEAPAAEKPPEVSAEEAKANLANQGVLKRRKLFRACLDSFRYVNSISQDEAVKVRDSDRATSIWLMIVSIFTVLAMLFEPLAPHRMPLLIACDVLIGISILYYIANRFGIIGTFNPRQALLAWQLMMGATFFGIFLTINLALVLGLAAALMGPTEIPRL